MRIVSDLVIFCGDVNGPTSVRKVQQDQGLEMEEITAERAAVNCTYRFIY